MVKIKLFSLYRDVARVSELEIDVKECNPERIISILVTMYPSLKQVFEDVPPMIFVDGNVVSLELNNSFVKSCSEIGIAPPASGGSSIKVGFFSNDSDISLNDIISYATQEKKAGAIAMFIGVVKGEVEGKEVFELVYEAYEPYASKIMENIAFEAMKKYDLHTVQILHRIGNAKPGQKTLVIVVSAESRKKVVEALSQIIERIKNEVPIYKLEKRVDGDYWIIGDGIRYKKT